VKEQADGWSGTGGMIREPGSDVKERERQAATGTGRRKPGSAMSGFVVGDRRPR